MSVLIDEYMWVLSCCETYYYHIMIIFSNHWFLELVAMTASENHRNLRAITDYYGITNPRGFNADHTSDNRHYCYGGSLETQTLRIHITQLLHKSKVFLQHLEEYGF